MCVNTLSKVALDSAAAGIEPAISSRKSNALTTAPPSHTNPDDCNVIEGADSKRVVDTHGLKLGGGKVKVQRFTIARCPLLVTNDFVHTATTENKTSVATRFRKLQ